MSAMDGALLQVRGLRKWFGGLQAVDGVDLSVRPGEARAIIGPNGAGKTTLFNLISGHLRPNAGQVLFQGQDITGRPPHAIVHAGIGRAFQITSIFSRLSVFESVQMALLAKQKRTMSFFRPRARLVVDQTTAILEAVGLGEQAKMPAGAISHGDQRALELAISLAANPTLLMLDEPTAGMSPWETGRTMEMIRRIAREQGITLLFCEHDMEVVFGTADRITVMHQGRVLAEGTTNEIRQNTAVQEVYLGSDEQ